MTDDLNDRLMDRFEDDSEDQTGENEDEAKTEMTSSTSQTSQKAKNIKKEWNVRSFYLDDDLDSELTTTFKRLDLELEESDIDVNLKKTRHFYPLIVALGLERLEEMESTEITEYLEGTDFL
ncbi:hypothetical protein [Halovenus salina]|uniref:DUF8160 domain-containing protein n=1 Tax=Halovenus salina TaxID=1510225 RepID=A0ABD5W6P6_9EURY